MYIYTINGRNTLVMYNHFFINNYTFFMFYLFIFINFINFFLLIGTTKKTNLTKNIDYLFSINNLSIILPYIFFVNTTFTFLFVLELISTTILYKLVSSKI